MKNVFADAAVAEQTVFRFPLLLVSRWEKPLPIQAVTATKIALATLRTTALLAAKQSTGSHLPTHLVRQSAKALGSRSASAIFSRLVIDVVCAESASGLA